MLNIRQLVILIIGILVILNLAGCSNVNSDTECEISNWYGTFDKISEVCDNGGTPFFEDTMFWQAGSCDNCIADMSTIEHEVEDDCTFSVITPLSWEFNYELDGEFIYIKVLSFECEATYQRR